MYCQYYRSSLSERDRLREISQGYCVLTIGVVDVQLQKRNEMAVTYDGLKYGINALESECQTI